MEPLYHVIVVLSFALGADILIRYSLNFIDSYHVSSAIAFLPKLLWVSTIAYLYYYMTH